MQQNPASPAQTPAAGPPPGLDQALTSSVWRLEQVFEDNSKKVWELRFQPNGQVIEKQLPDGKEESHGWKTLPKNSCVYVSGMVGIGAGDFKLWFYKDLSGFTWYRVLRDENGSGYREGLIPVSLAGEPAPAAEMSQADISQVLTSYAWMMDWSKVGRNNQDWMVGELKIHPDPEAILRLYPDGTGSLGNSSRSFPFAVPLRWCWTADKEVVLTANDGNHGHIYIWPYKDLTGFYWMEYETADNSTAYRVATSAQQALVSSWWRIQSDVGESQLQFLPDGTTRGPGSGTWAATGPLTFKINGNVSCIFDERFNGFIGHFFDDRGTHRVTGTRLGSVSNPALASRPNTGNAGQTPAVAPVPGGRYSPIDATTLRLVANVNFAQSVTGFITWQDANWKLNWTDGEYQMVCQRLGFGGCPSRC